MGGFYDSLYHIFPLYCFSEMGWFDAFRDGGSNTYYQQQRNAVVFDINIVAIVFFTVVIATAGIIFVIGSRGREVRNSLF